jgi:TetR/AcrR family transcriptional regulator, ethionamide resistance regulator
LYQPRSSVIGRFVPQIGRYVLYALPVAITHDEIEARRFAARKREIVDRILPVVEQLLDHGGGYRNVTVEQIARRSGMARSSFYRYFSDKHELLIAVSAPALEAIIRAALRPWDLGPEITRERLEAELFRTMDEYRPHIPLLAAMIEASTYEPTARQAFVAAFDEIRDRVAGHIAEGQTQGYIHRDLHPKETAGWITWMAERGMSELAADAAADTATLTRLVESLTAIVWRAIYTQGER